MQCEICSKKEAVVHFKHVADGELRELNICEDCAAKNGLSIQPPDLLTDFLMGKGKKPVSQKEPQQPLRKCVVCGMSDVEFGKISRFGCAECYDVFETEVEDVARSVQKGHRHVGRFPGTISSKEDMAKLSGMLDEAVAVQNFEEAARIRDVINSLKPARPKKAGRRPKKEAN
jgi:protein arginine kinase activator